MKERCAGSLGACAFRTAPPTFTLTEACKFSAVDALAWLADVLARIADHPARRSPICYPGTGSPTAPWPEPICSPCGPGRSWPYAYSTRSSNVEKATSSACLVTRSAAWPIISPRVSQRECLWTQKLSSSRPTRPHWYISSSLSKITAFAVTTTQ
jgi:hypothetical protein